MTITHPPLAAAARRPRVQDFALLFGLDSAVRGLMLSVVPLVMYRAWGEGTLVSAFFLGAGLVSLLAGLLVPWASRRIPRGQMLVMGGLFYLLGITLFLTGAPWLVALALAIHAVSTVTVWVSLSAYVLDFVPRQDLARNESTRLLYSATAWTFGPFAGVLLLDWWRPAPFLLAGGFALLMVTVFHRLNLGNGKPVGAPSRQGNPLAFLGRFLQRPRLVAGWTFATVRSCGWWVYIVYLPYFCITNGLGDTVGGAAVSVTNTFLFATPWLLRLMQWLSVRRAVRWSFAYTAILFLLAGILAHWPWATVVCIALSALGLIMLDVCGSLPFLMAVKPSERTEMAAVYSSFRDVSGILSPAVGGAILLIAPVSAIFVACGAGLAAAWAVAATVHPRLGRPKSMAP